jgi:hypothetical protein
MKRKTTTQPREKSKIVSMELKIHKMFVTVYVRRRFSGDKLAWKSYQNITPASLLRLARLTKIVTVSEMGVLDGNLD